MSNNKTLHSAKDAKNDEFYTQLADVEKEMQHYKQHFKGKTVYCNCDNPEWSMFWAYFHVNFSELGLEELVSTHYKFGAVSYKLEYIGGNDNDILAGIKAQLIGNGDFRSDECVEVLKQSDIVVTNPPFSLFREYIALLEAYNKKFIILGNMNAITYKEIFPLLKDNRIWLGCKSINQNMYFNVPDERKQWLLGNKKEGSAYKIINGVVMGRLASACWFTNLDIAKRHEKLNLTKVYNKENYQHYDNYNAIEVSKVSDIPVDYAGVMGVPITFLGSYNPEQFEIIKFRKGDDEKDLAVNGKCPYFRILIKRKVK